MVIRQFNWLRDYLLAQKSGKNNIKLFIILHVFVIGLLAFYSFGVLAEVSDSNVREVSNGEGGTNCWIYNGNFSGCRAVNSSCIWGNNSGTFLQDPWCMINSTNFNSTSDTMWFINGFLPYNNITKGLIYNAGCCVTKPGAGGGGGVQMGCWSFDGNKSGCSNSSNYGVT